MRPILAPVLLTLLAAPLPAAAQAHANDAFCAGLRQLVAAAASGFDYLPANQRLLPGSIAERRGVTRSEGGPPRAAFFAVMLRDASAQRPNPAEARFRALQAAIPRCLPDVAAGPGGEGPRGAVASWTIQQAVIGLRYDAGDGFASTAEIEISVASRW